MSSAINTWYLVRSYDGRFRYILALTLHEHRVLMNELMYDYVCQPFDSKRLASMALSSPNVRIHADEPDHVCYANANVVAIKNQLQEAFSAATVLALVPGA